MRNTKIPEVGDFLSLYGKGIWEVIELNPTRIMQRLTRHGNVPRSTRRRLLEEGEHAWRSATTPGCVPYTEIYTTTAEDLRNDIETEKCDYAWKAAVPAKALKHLFNEETDLSVTHEAVDEKVRKL